MASTAAAVRLVSPGTGSRTTSSPGSGSVYVTVRQVKAGFVARGSGRADAACDGTVKAWTMTIESETFRAFTNGWATLAGAATVCDRCECVNATPVTMRLRIHGSRNLRVGLLYGATGLGG